MTQRVHSSGIYHGLPVFARIPKQSVLVAGANGITGAHVVGVLREHPERWSTIYALSRKAPTHALGGNVKSLQADLLGSPTDIAAQLREAGPIDFVFYTAYVQPPPKEGGGLWSDTEETERVNVLMLANLLEALRAAGKIPQRFVLQTGAKHYGVHIGPTLSPMEESDPRYVREPNFYFAQEDLLWRWAGETGAAWNVTRPGFIIGAVPEAAMSIALGLALYGAVQRELGRPLTFPGDASAWTAEKHVTSSRLIGHHAEWLFQTAEAANEVLNVADGGPFSYGKFWPVLAAVFGMAYEPPDQSEEAYQTVTMPETQPPRGFGPAGQFRANGSMDEWSVRPEVREAWAAVKVRHGLQHRSDPFDNHQDVFGLLDGELLGPWPRSMSMSKNRRLGWHGFVDSVDGFLETFAELARLRMIPPLPERQSIRYVGY